MNNIYILELSSSAILPLELHCSTIAIFYFFLFFFVFLFFFAIVGFYKSGCVGVWSFYNKFSLHMTYFIPNVNALRPRLSTFDFCVGVCDCIV